MARRAAGEGSINQRKDGRWQATIQIGGRRYSVYGTTRKEASEKLQKLQYRHASGSMVTPSKITVSGFLEQWLDEARLTRKASTIHGYADIIAVHLNPVLGDLKLQRLGRQNLVALYREKQTKGYSGRRVAIIHAVIRRALEDAVAWGLVPSNVAATIKPPSSESKPRAMWNDEELRRFVSMAMNRKDPYAWALVFMLSTGIRVSEMFGLTWDCVNAETGIVSITKALVWAGGPPTWQRPKSKAGIRRIPLPPLAIVCLNRLRDWQTLASRKVKSPWKNTDGRVLSTDTGGVPTPTLMKRALGTICELADIPVITVHGLRHHYASILIGAGADVKQAQMLLGHSRPSVTLDIYSHLISPDQSIAQTVQKAMERGKPNV